MLITLIVLGTIFAFIVTVIYHAVDKFYDDDQDKGENHF